jgi:hypothetical protein
MIRILSLVFVLAVGLGGLVASGTTPGASVQAASCGGLNQRPCKLFDRGRRCQKGLKVHLIKKRCVRRRPILPRFLDGVRAAAGKLAQTSRLCKKLLGSLPSIRVTRGPINTVINCRRGYSIGYRCAAPKVFNLVAKNAKLAGRLDAAFRNPACRKVPKLLRSLCALGKVVDDFAVRPALCMTAVVSRGGFTKLADGHSKTIELMCTAAGETAFEIAVNRAIRKRLRGKDNAARFLRKVRKIKRLGRKGAKIERFFRKLEREPACRGVLN